MRPGKSRRNFLTTSLSQLYRFGLLHDNQPPPPHSSAACLERAKDRVLLQLRGAMRLHMIRSQLEDGMLGLMLLQEGPDSWVYKVHLAKFTLWLSMIKRFNPQAIESTQCWDRENDVCATGQAV